MERLVAYIGGVDDPASAAIRRPTPQRLFRQ
jgi:hypothetical protein